MNMQIDTWDVFWASIGTVFEVWGKTFEQNPLLWIGLVALGIIGLLLPARRRRRRR